MKSRIVASTLVYYADQFVFITQDKPGGAYPNTLHLPGGGLEPDETPISAAVREVREETGLELRSITPIDFDWDVLSYKGEQTLLIYLRFIGEATSRAAVARSDATAVLWLDKNSLRDHFHNPPNQRLLKKLNLI